MTFDQFFEEVAKPNGVTREAIARAIWASTPDFARNAPEIFRGVMEAICQAMNADLDRYSDEELAKGVDSFLNEHPELHQSED